jgi:IS4 transposase
MGVKYLIRLHSREYVAERRGMRKKDEEVELEQSKNRLRMFRKKSPDRAEELEAKGNISARIIKMNFPTETGAALITNLPEECRAGEIQRLYRQRWEIEKKNHTLKNKLKFESVIGKASIYVEQDFWA